MYSTSGNIKVTPDNDSDEVVNELFESFCPKYQDNLETSMRGRDFTFDSVQLMVCKCHQVSFKYGSSDIHSLDWIKNKKATINPKMKIINGFNRQQMLH